MLRDFSHVYLNTVYVLYIDEMLVSVKGYLLCIHNLLKHTNSRLHTQASISLQSVCG